MTVNKLIQLEEARANFVCGELAMIAVCSTLIDLLLDWRW